MRRWGVRVLFVVLSLGTAGLVAPASGASGPLPPPASGGWSSTGSPTKVAIRDLGLFALPGGDALKLGNWWPGYGFTLFQAERWSAASGTWSEAARPATRRQEAATVALPDGRVMMAGGLATDTYSYYTYLATTELYNPASGTWSSGPTLAQARRFAKASVVSDRAVLVVGGQSSAGTAGTELLDLVTGTSTPAPSPPVTGYYSVVGSGPSVLALSNTEAYVYELATNTWSAVSRPAGVVDSSVVLPDQRVLILLNPVSGPQVAAIFNPADRTWTIGPGLGASSAKLTALNDGRVLAVRGYEGAPAYASTLDTSALDGWHPVDAPENQTAGYSEITTLSDGRALFASFGDSRAASLFDATVAARPYVYALTGDRSSLVLDVTQAARFRLKLVEQTTATPLGGIGILGGVVSGPNLGARHCWQTNCVAESTGKVDFVYAGTGGPGLDTIVLTADLDGDGIATDGEPTFSATVQWNRITTYITGPAYLRWDAQGLPALGPMKARLTSLVKGDYGSSSSPVRGRTIRFSVGSGTDCIAVTDTDGWATCASTTDPVAVARNGGYTASYAGERDYSPSQGKPRFVDTIV